MSGSVHDRDVGGLARCIRRVERDAGYRILIGIDAAGDVCHQRDTCVGGGEHMSAGRGRGTAESLGPGVDDFRLSVRVFWSARSQRAHEIDLAAGARIGPAALEIVAES